LKAFATQARTQSRARLGDWVGSHHIIRHNINLVLDVQQLQRPAKTRVVPEGRRRLCECRRVRTQQHQQSSGSARKLVAALLPLGRRCRACTRRPRPQAAAHPRAACRPARPRRRCCRNMARALGGRAGGGRQGRRKGCGRQGGVRDGYGQCKREDAHGKKRSGVS